MAIRNLSKLVSNSNFSQKTHNFLLSNPGVTWNPASYYFNSQYRSLEAGHSQTPFSLGLISYELSRQNNNLSELLQRNVKNSANDEIQVKYSENVETIKNYLSEFSILVRTESFNLPIQICTNAVYAFENNNLSAPELYQKYLFPTIKSKINYISYQGAADLIISLVKGNQYQDKELISLVLEQLKEKSSFLANSQKVNFHSWKLNQYEQADNQNKKFYASEDQRFFEESQNSSNLANIKHWIRVNYSNLWNRILSPFLFREKRVNYEFDQINSVEEKKKLGQALIELGKHVKDSKINEIIANLEKIN